MSRDASLDATDRLYGNLDAPHPDRILADLKAMTRIPFSADDVTAGTENELQAAVVGHSNDVDLPLAIRSSNYFKNILQTRGFGRKPEASPGTTDGLRLLRAGPGLGKLLGSHSDGDIFTIDSCSDLP